MKKENLIKEKWYKNTKWDAGYLKWENSNHYSERIWSDGRYENTHGSTGSGWMDYAEEVSLEEIQKYLPKNHPDRIDKETKLKFFL